MKEILFRGKRKDTGEWVEGFFVSQGNETYIFEQKEVDKGIDLGGYLDCCQMREVIPETVGRLIINPGYGDYSSQRYFQGDVIELYGRHFEHQDYKKYIGIVVDEHSFTENGLGRRFPQDILQAKVIGNKWDNPELLEVK